MTQASKAACVVYHNPRCSKSRTALALLQERGAELKVVEYLKTPPTAAELKSILAKLKLKPADLLRRGEDEYQSHVAGKALSDAQLIDLMVKHPALIERPIVVKGDRAVLGRPPENVLTLF